MSTLTWKHGGGLVPKPPQEETAASGKTAKNKPGTPPAEVVVGVDPGAEEGDRTVVTVAPPETAGAAELIRGE